jgi:predicted ATPase
MIVTEPFIHFVALLRERVPSFDAYPFSIPAVRHLRKLDLHRSVTFLIGENGTGKSTLLEAIAVADGFNPEGGTRNFNFSTRDSHSELYKCIQLGRGVRRARHDSFFLRAESFYNVATEIDQRGLIAANSPYGPVSFHAQSHGEAFLTLMINRFSGNGFYLLDEPESALSPQRQLSFLTALHDLVRRGSQLIIATHSPLIMAYPEATIYWLSDDGIERVEYEDTEHFKVTRAFFSRREKMLAELLSDE